MKNKTWMYSALVAMMACSETEVPPREDASPERMDSGTMPPTGGECPSLTKTLDEHVVFGSAVKRADGYFAKDAPNASTTTEFLGLDGNQEVTLYITNPVQTRWTSDARSCVNSPICGDGIRSATALGEELCEGDDLHGSTCADHGFLGGGTLSCTTYCTFDTDNCESVCGNGVVEGLEGCDGDAFRERYYTDGDLSCVGLDSKYIGGTLSCRSDCRIDESACLTPVCGDGIVEGWESCDGAALPITDCADYNPVWRSGTLSCGETCRYDTSQCVDRCGDGVLDEWEECDGPLRRTDFAGDNCSDYQYPFSSFPFGIHPRYLGGSLRCVPGECQLSFDQCEVPPGCYLLPVKFGSLVKCTWDDDW